jgi:hypothetical protein
VRESVRTAVARPVLPFIAHLLGVTVATLEQVRDAVIPAGLERADTTSRERPWLGFDGIDMNDEDQLALLRSWSGHECLFRALRADPAINPPHASSELIQNGFYSTPDAEIYAAMIASERPAVIIEVGGGFSTLIARAALELLELRSTTLFVVDPEPRTDITSAADFVVRRQVEQTDPGALPLDEPVLLFIDSSHVIRTGGDVPHLYNKVIPRLVPGSLVHSHDIGIPFDYPPFYQSRLYTEHYVLHALLQGSLRFKVAFATQYLGWKYPDELTAVFGKDVPTRNRGSSFWFRVCEWPRHHFGSSRCEHPPDHKAQ